MPKCVAEKDCPTNLTLYRDAIAIAYIVQDLTLFKRATEYALVHHDNEQLEQEIGGGLSKVLPDGMIGKFKPLTLISSSTGILG